MSIDRIPDVFQKEQGVLSDLVEREESKRDRCWDPRDRWRTLLETIEWAEAQQPVPRNSRQRCIEEQAKKLATRAGRS